MLLLDPAAERVQNALNVTRELIKSHDGEITGEQDMGIRRTAYPVSGRTECRYYLFHLTIDGSLLGELERQFRIEDDVLRHLVIRLHENTPKEKKSKKTKAPSENEAHSQHVSH